MTSGQYLKSFMKHRQISYSMACEMLTKSKPALINWINSKTVMPYSELQKIRAVFELNHDEYMLILSAVQIDVIKRWRNT